MEHLLDALLEKIKANESNLVKRWLPNLLKLFATLSFAELRQNTSDTVSEASAGQIVSPVKVVHPSFQPKVIYTTSSASSRQFTRQYAKR